MSIRLLAWRVFDPKWLMGRAEAAAQEAAAEAGREVKRRSNAIAPRRSGALIASSSVTVDGPRATVRYSAPYARIQHEAAFRHPGGGQSHYLSSVVESCQIQAMADAAFAKAMIRRMK